MERKSFYSNAMISIILFYKQLMSMFNILIYNYLIKKDRNLNTFVILFEIERNFPLEGFFTVKKKKNGKIVYKKYQKNGLCGSFFLNNTAFRVR